MNRIDQQAEECMKHAEKKCRKVKCGKIPFWAGKKTNRGNLKRLARRVKVPNPFGMSKEDVAMRLRECKQQCKYFQHHGQKYRRKLLNRKLEEAREREDEEAERRILQIIARERDRAFWWRLNWSLGKRRGASVGSVQVKNPDGETVELTTQNEVQDAIWKEVHQSRYHLAEEAPICNGNLRGEFGYNADTLAARQVLDGSYEFGEDFHASTQRIMRAIADTRSSIPKDSIEQVITREIWQQKWKKKKEETSSSVSGLHFGHYISGAHSDEISDFHALKTSLVLVHGIALKRWSSGLCVMLEKVLGVRLISKLRAILLINAMNKIMFGERMMDNVRKYKLLPEEIFSEKNREATDGAIAKKLFFDISRQLKRPAGMGSVDASNCYDRVIHAISSLIFQAFGAPSNSCKAMHNAIQEMKFFLRTAFGDSSSAVGAKINLKTQGFMQGNGAAPAGWAVVSITIISAHKAEGHGATFLCPISKLSHKVAGILYVDDTDILHLNLEKEETLEEAHVALQASLDSWSELLVATGGALKPEKCFFYLLGYQWDRNGKWSYIKCEDKEDYDVQVSLPDGSRASIKHLSVDEARITLGVSSCPSDKPDPEWCTVNDKASPGAMIEMQNKAMAWANQAKNSHLRPRDIHFSVAKKFWPKVKYGLCTNTTQYEKLVEAMHKPYKILCPLGGVIRTAKRKIRYLDTGFFGVGLPHWGIESLVESVNKVMTHLGTRSLVGVQFQMSAELLAIEVGMGPSPLTLIFRKYGSWATQCTLKSLWEKLDRFSFKLQICNINLIPPREGDGWFMAAGERIGYERKQLEILNRVRQHQQVLFESDVFGSDGRHLDERYLHWRPQNEKWSTLLFGKQFIPPGHFNLWKHALLQIAPSRRRAHALGDFRNQSHKIWQWQYDPDDNILLRSTGVEGEYTRYDKSELLSLRRDRYTPNCTVYPSHKLQICSAREIGDGSVQISAPRDLAPSPTPPDNFLIDVLEEWGCTWLWREMRMTNSSGMGLDIQANDGGAWLVEAIEDNTLMGVTDGSFIRELCPHICSAAVVVECSKGRGRLVLSFPEKSLQANANRGELLGLLALHLLLLSLNKTKPDLSGSVEIFSDCLGALHKVEHLPPHRIPSKCRHSDILKTIMVNCQDLSFKRIFSHVSAPSRRYQGMGGALASGAVELQL